MGSQLHSPNTEAAIWARLMQSPSEKLSPETAEFLLSIRFGEGDVDRMHQLAERSTEGMLTDDERTEFDSYLRVGNFLAVMQSKARRALGRPIRES
jgi:hypothetical protein